MRAFSVLCVEMVGVEATVQLEVYDEDKGGYARLAGDETTAKDAKKERLRPILELAKAELGKMARCFGGPQRGIIN